VPKKLIGLPIMMKSLTGMAVRLFDGTIRIAEIHWFEADGIGKRKMRIKRFRE